MPYDAANNRITLSFPNVTPDGRYVVTLSSSGITNATGGPLDGDGNGTTGPDFDFNFFFMAGDANHDRAVDFNDLVALAQHYNAPGISPAQGDFNYDDVVDFNDLVILAQRYNTSLPAAGASATLAAPATLFTTDWTAATTSVTAPITPASKSDPKKTHAKPIFSITPVAKPVPVKRNAPQRRR
jgi:hypothetical protein